jgi:hypothetical protein
LVRREVAARGCGHVPVAGDVPVTRVLDRAPHLQPWKGKPHEIILENYVKATAQAHATLDETIHLSLYR